MFRGYIFNLSSLEKEPGPQFEIFLKFFPNSYFNESNPLKMTSLGQTEGFENNLNLKICQKCLGGK